MLVSLIGRDYEAGIRGLMEVMSLYYMTVIYHLFSVIFCNMLLSYINFGDLLLTPAIYKMLTAYMLMVF